MLRLLSGNVEPALRLGSWTCLIAAVLILEKVMEFKILEPTDLNMMTLGVVFSSLAAIEIQFLSIYRQMTAEVGSISDGLEMIFRRHHDFSKVRIFAYTGDHLTGQISDIGKNLGVSIEACEVLLYDQSTDNNKSAKRSPNFDATIDSACNGAIARLATLRSEGRIRGSLLVGRYNSMPNDYYVIFDDRAMLSGRFRRNLANPLGAELQKAARVVFGTRAEFRNMIQDRCQAFDALTKEYPLYEINLARGERN
jgi:hypothetical protein